MRTRGPRPAARGRARVLAPMPRRGGRKYQESGHRGPSGVTVFNRKSQRELAGPQTTCIAKGTNVTKKTEVLDVFKTLKGSYCAALAPHRGGPELFWVPVRFSAGRSPPGNEKELAGTRPLGPSVRPTPPLSTASGERSLQFPPQWLPARPRAEGAVISRRPSRRPGGRAAAPAASG